MILSNFELFDRCRPLSHLTIRWSRHVQSIGQWQTIPADDEVKYQLSPLNRVLTIFRPSPSDAGVYRCDATLRRPTGTAPTTAGQVVTAEARLTVHGITTLLLLLLLLLLPLLLLLLLLLSLYLFVIHARSFVLCIHLFMLLLLTYYFLLLFYFYPG